MTLIKTIFTALFCCNAAFAAPMEFTVSHAPGGPSDIATRIVSRAVGDSNFVIINRPGAGGRIAMRQLLSEKTVMLATMSQIYVTNPIIFKDLEYTDKDIELIGVVASMPNVLVCNAGKGIKTMGDFLTTKKSFNFGTSGYGGSEHLATEVLIAKASGNHLAVPYSKGGAATVSDLASGQLDCMFSNFPTVKGWVGDPRLNFIMSSHDLGLKIPTWADTFKEPFPFQSYLGMIVAAKMDPAAKEELRNKLVAAFKKQELKDDLVKAGLFPVLSTDEKIINFALKNNMLLRDFILKNAIKLN